jgi:tetratricopeptide (TPR) repeat protein
MEILNMKTKTILIGFFILAFAFNLNAQSQEDLQKAFADSYSYESIGKYTDAVQSLKKHYSNESYEINVRLAWLSYMSGQYTESISYYKKAIKLQPLSIEARLGLCYPSSAVGNWEQVIQQYNEILKVAPNNYTANLRLGQIYMNRKKYTQASKHLDILISQYPFTYDVMINTAWNYYYQGKLREAKVLFQKVLLVYSNDESALLGLKSIK